MCEAVPIGRFHIPRAPAFSLIELVIVVVIIGIIAAIALPRFSSTTTTSVISASAADVVVLEKAIAHYAAEHDDRTPAHETTGDINTDEATFAKRLMQTSNAAGDTGNSLLYGPYVRELPHNPVNRRRRIRIDGPPAGANTHGWRFDSTTRVIEADDKYIPLVLDHKSANIGDTTPITSAELVAEATAAAAALPSGI